jgi:hypothetical protein
MMMMMMMMIHDENDWSALAASRHFLQMVKLIPASDTMSGVRPSSSLKSKPHLAGDRTINDRHVSIVVLVTYRQVHGSCMD